MVGVVGMVLRCTAWAMLLMNSIVVWEVGLARWACECYESKVALPVQLRQWR